MVYFGTNITNSRSGFNFTPTVGPSTASYQFTQSTPAFGSTPTSSLFSFGESTSHLATASTSGVTTRYPSLFENSPRPFLFGCQGTSQQFLGNECGGSRVLPYRPSCVVDEHSHPGPSPPILFSISAMDAYLGKSHEELRLEDYQRQRNGGTAQQFAGNECGGSRVVPYRPSCVVDEHSQPGASPPNLFSISAMDAYLGKSHEELRLENYQQQRNGGTATSGSALSPSRTSGNPGGSGFASTIPTTTSGSVFSHFGTSGGYGFLSSTAAFSSASSTPGFGSASTTPAFGSTFSSTPAFGSTSSTPAFGSTSSTPAFGSSSTACSSGVLTGQTIPHTSGYYPVASTSGFLQPLTSSMTSGFGSSFGGSFSPLYAISSFGSSSGASTSGLSSNWPSTCFSFPTTSNLVKEVPSGSGKPPCFSFPRTEPSLVGGVSNQPPKKNKGDDDSSVTKDLELMLANLGINPWEHKDNVKNSREFLPCEDASNDADIIALADFAVQQHNAMDKDGTCFFVKVVSAHLEAVDGGRYHIVLEVRDAPCCAPLRKIYAVVLRKKTLLSNQLMVLEKWLPGA